MNIEVYNGQIRSIADIQNCFNLYKRYPPEVGAFDTETDGLHLTQSLPFVFQFGWLYQDKFIYTFVVDLLEYPVLGRALIRMWNKRAELLKIYLGHNVKFDLHMLANYGEPYLFENLSDTTFYIRYAHDALSPKDGGPVLKLKQYCAKYIDANARNFEKGLSVERTAIAKSYNLLLKKALGWTLAKLDKVFGDPTFIIDELPSEEREAYLKWYNELPEDIRRRVLIRVKADDIPYTRLNRENVLIYAAKDIEYTLKVYLFLKDIIALHHNESAIAVENSLILPLFEMERVGLRVDKDYLSYSKEQVRALIKKLRAELAELCGEAVTVNQHVKIVSMLQALGIACYSSNAEELNRTYSILVRSGQSPKGVRMIELIQDLRTLEKWFSTYIMRFELDLKRTDHIFTEINQVGTVSVRVTSDFQQFPKEAIYTREGEELFHPRKMILVEGGEYDATVYLDYSQIELRFQALYTMLLEAPEVNLIRAYEPYDCTNETLGVFNPKNKEHLQHWKDYIWFYNEDLTKQWEPTDLHGLTTCFAFDITPEHPDYHKLRSIGKRLNFAKNYGAQESRVAVMFPEFDAAQIKKINEAYFKAFPNLKTYQTYCYNLANAQAYATNLFGVRYYGVSGHDLINRLIQGSCASFLKIKIRECYDYCKANNIKSRFQMNIHDELSWCKHKDESLDVFYALKEIMEDWPETLIPIIANMEITYTTWADKKEVT